jgi:hypothetical protein
MISALSAPKVTGTPVVTGKLRVVLGCDTEMSRSPTKVWLNGYQMAMVFVPFRVAEIVFGERRKKNTDKLIE